MRRNRGVYVAAVMIATLSGCASPGTPSAATPGSELGGSAEEIYVFRTTRTRHVRGPTAACAPAPFASANEDYYELWSIELRSRDSRLVDARRSAVGGFTACLGQLAAGQPVPMYAMGTLAEIPWTGVGECMPAKSQPPIRTAIAFTCRLDLNGLPPKYAGGFLVSSTLAPALGANQPANAHVPGYLSTSIVSVRLWKKTDPRAEIVPMGRAPKPLKKGSCRLADWSYRSSLKSVGFIASAQAT